MQINFNLKNAELHLPKSRISNLKTKLWKNIKLNEEEINIFFQKNKEKFDLEIINDESIKEEKLKNLLMQIRKTIFFKIKNVIFYPSTYALFSLNFKFNKNNNDLINDVYKNTIILTKNEILTNEIMKNKLEKLNKLKKMQKEL